MSEPISIKPADIQKPVGIYIEHIQIPKIPHVEMCRDGKLHMDGCLQDRLGDAAKGLQALTASVGSVVRAFGLAAALSMSPQELAILHLGQIGLQTNKK